MMNSRLLILLCFWMSACGSSIEKNDPNNDNPDANNATNNSTNNDTNNSTISGTTGSNNGTISSGPCIELSTPEIDFGEVDAGLRGEFDLTVTNCGEDVQDITVGVAGSEFSTLVDEAFVEPGDNFVVTILFSPTAVGDATGAVTILSGTSSIVVPLTGTGGEAECPIARAIVSDGAGNAGPTITIEQGQQFMLNGDGSQAFQGLIASYRWSSDALVNIDDVSASQTTATALVVGTSQVELFVTDENGIESCVASSVTIEIVPSSGTDIVVSVVWETPADADQTDNNGTDLDLHFARDGAAWNQAPFDCFWDNRNPMWGDLNTTDDDPNLVIDDTDGAGPETLELASPEAVTYNIGVDYFSDKSFGPSYATLTVTRGGVLLFEDKDKFLAKTKTFWFVAAFNGANGTVLPIDQISDGFP